MMDFWAMVGSSAFLKDVRRCLQEISEIASLPSRSRISLLRRASGRFGRG
jgi:hypothetical protein